MRMTNYEVIVLSEEDPHAPSCFPCFECNQCMAGKEFFSRCGHKYCAKCFAQSFGLKCALCEKVIEGISRLNFIFYENKVWHERCFKWSNSCKTFNEARLSKRSYCLNCTRCGAQVSCQNNR